ncbi:MAG: PaaI family thioesterase [Trichlorobacter sp.]|uniref:PaaI family thioesterase n=1 Tax=Trichlorobacter sp. TaxID=2911007 RepID=UPI002560C998|nr:PaaI family thioesterase [Trichlorobacter sp.]MDK9716890.1 PaaI family thioesterase [Trichlorobacter sp.]
MAIEPATPESINNISLLQTLGIQLQEIGERHAVMCVTVDERHCNYFGGAHGGLLATLVDTASFFPRPLLPSGVACTTTSLQVNYIRPAAAGDLLTARSELLHLGRRTASVRVEVTNQEDKLVVHGTVGLLVLE